jgi:hypothetical protein
MFHTEIDSRDDRFVNVNYDEIFDCTMFAAGIVARAVEACDISAARQDSQYRDSSIAKATHSLILQLDLVPAVVAHDRAGWRLSSVAGNAPLDKSSLFIGCSGVTTTFPRRSADFARLNDALPSGAAKTKRLFANSTINSLRRMDAFLVMRFAFVLQ